jgi:ABC-type transport system involved in multi-copper enzyme maturation permease subunit
MRPYIAIIKDAFREAFWSRTLWILLVLITLFLLLLLPLSYRETLSSGLGMKDVTDGQLLIQRIARASRSERPSPGKHIFSLLDENLQRSIEAGLERAENKNSPDVPKPVSEASESSPDKVTEGESKPDDGRPDDGKDKQGQIVRDPVALYFMTLEDLNQKMELDEFYDEASWESKRMRQQVTDILAEKSLDKSEVMHRNRLLLEQAFPDIIRPAPDRKFIMTYLFFDTPVVLQMQKSDFYARIQFIVLVGLLLVFGTAGIMIAIMVTAPIIPQTFDPGSLSLLLSKPISRSLMFISQYLGGLAFITILASYTFAGICLILGTRLGLWNLRILYYIPCFVFIFAIYYSVSSLVSLIWRSTTLSIILTIIFWMSCATVGMIKFFFDMPLSTQLASKEVIVSNRDVFVVRNAGDVLRWDADESDWKSAFADSFGQGSLVIHGPFLDAQRNRLVGQVGTMGGDGMSFAPEQELRFAGPDDNWLRHKGPRLPIGVLDVQPHPQEGFIAIAVSGFYRFKGELVIPEAKPEDEANKEENANAKQGPGRRPRGGGLFDFLNSDSSPASDEFEQIGPNTGLSLFTPWVSAVNQTDGRIAIYSRDTLSVFQRAADGPYTLLSTVELTGETSRDVQLGFGGDTILLYRPLDGMIIYDANTLEEKKRLKIQGHTSPKLIRFSQSGDVAAVTLENKKLWLFDAKAEAFVRPSVKHQNNVLSASFNLDGELVYCDRWLAVYEADVSSRQIQNTYRGKQDWFIWFYQFILEPVYTIFPKPGSLNNTAQYLVTGDDTREDYRVMTLKNVIPIPGIADALEAQIPRVYLDPWPPVWNGLIFISIILGLGCFYLERQQF